MLIRILDYILMVQNSLSIEAQNCREYLGRQIMKFFFLKLFVTALIISSSSVYVFAEEIFRCYDHSDRDKSEVLMTLTVPKSDSDVGKIHVSGAVIDAKYYLEGINRSWNFDDYIVAIQPNGEAIYSIGGVVPLQHFLCEKINQ